MLMRVALYLAALLLFPNTPVFANTDIIELDCEAEWGEYNERTEDSEETINDSDRGFSIVIDKFDSTFDMIQDGRNEDLVYLNKLDEQGELSQLNSNYSSFIYSKKEAYDTLDIETDKKERGIKDTHLVIYISNSEIDFRWSVDFSATEGEWRKTSTLYVGKCFRKN